MNGANTQSPEVFGVSLHMDALSPSIVEQLDRNGLKLKSSEDAVSLQRDADAITRCLVRELIPPTVGRRARQKLVNRISKLVLPKG